MSNLETAPAAGKTIKAIMDDFVKGQNALQKVIGKPSFTTTKPVIDAVEINLINITATPARGFWGIYRGFNFFAFF